MRLAPPTRKIAPLAIALAVWTALPSLEWCPLSWEDCRAACAVAPRVAGGSSAKADCDAGATCRPAAASAGTSCGPTAAQAGASCSSAGACPLAHAVATGALPCDPTPDSNAPIGDRAWCIHPPIDGVPAREIALRGPSSASSALPARAHDPLTLVAVRIAKWVADVYSPTEADAHARPPTRAPPLL